MPIDFNNNTPSNEKKDGGIIYLWCFSPSVAFNKLMKQGVRQILLTSGTLEPLDSFEAELGLPFAIKLENQHVIDTQTNLLSLVINTFADLNNRFYFSYNNKQNIGMIVNLGETIINLFNVIPNGVLIFFPTYSWLQICFDVWINHEHDIL